MFTGIEHFAIASPDPRRLAGWYCETLEFRIVYEYDGNYFVRASNGVLLEIVAAAGERAADEPRSPGIRHIAIGVQDFEAATSRLGSAGVNFTGPPYENQGNRLVFFEDCDGNRLHLIQRSQPLP